MSQPTLYDRVAARCASADIPVSACGIAEIDRYLGEERANDVPQQPLRRLRAQSALGAVPSHRGEQ